MSAQADVELKDFDKIFRLDGKVAVVTGGSRGVCYMKIGTGDAN